MPDGVGFLSFATERVKTNKNVRSKEAALAAATESGQLLSKQLPSLKHEEDLDCNPNIIPTHPSY